MRCIGVMLYSCSKLRKVTRTVAVEVIRKGSVKRPFQSPIKVSSQQFVKSVQS